MQLIGYTGSDPLRGNTDFQPTKFSLATTVYYQSRNGNNAFSPFLQFVQGSNSTLETHIIIILAF